MASAHLLRQQVLDQLYQILKDPLLYGNKFLLNIINAPKDGLVSLKLVYSMTSQLKPYPVEYVEYCVPRDLDQRFRWSSDFTRVGLKENARFYETNAFGFIEEDLDNADTSIIPHQVQPVIYDNGKFYIDDEHHRSQGLSSVQFFEYELLDIQPLGKDTPPSIEGLLCYNCDKIGHHYRHCPRPKNYTKINSHSERLFTHVERDTMKAGRLSHQLKEALGMTLEGDEPPYYSRMRYYGYPPGYISNTRYSPNTETPMLKVYDGKYVIHTKDETLQDTLQSEPTYSVDYPGLYTSSNNEREQENNGAMDTLTSHTSDQTKTLQQKWDEYYYNQYQYQYYQQIYYGAEPPPPEMEPTVQATADISDAHVDTFIQKDNRNDSDDMDISSEDEG
ncbi:hypothetical protein HMPREF1544_12172 [Mucor circinelloides 1006PhL]|uniref:CCHC-type domain-containing protein n=1 Tax=Mucor circinelloides f. circinelloides (strain 1006PhL) TaxID=1220926 RepID=S2JF33_MUCC1|nr:hypothetical protein HMPREF1544_12172 [Mucor circinelloides 1006PhL]KAG1116587.1 hypothetical protein G6F42_013660 [Rhizopus arrhizus]